jgi:P27 family predicted phage terminase small subunit
MVPIPTHLKPETAKWFVSVCNTYVLEQHHVRLLTLACESWDRCAEARQIIEKHGMTFTNRWGEVKLRPEVNIERDSRIAFARLVRELCLSEEMPDEMRPPKLKYGGR